MPRFFIYLRNNKAPIINRIIVIIEKPIGNPKLIPDYYYPIL